MVRFGPNSVSFNSAQALKDIYGFRTNVRKAEFYDAFVHPAPNTHNARDREIHARKRRVLAHGFSDSAIREMERYVLNNVRTFTAQIGEGASQERKGWSLPKNMTDWCNYLAMDILGDLCFGKAFHMLEAPDNRFALDLIAAATKRHLIVSCPLDYEKQYQGERRGKETKATRKRKKKAQRLTFLVWHHACRRQAQARQVPVP